MTIELVVSGRGGFLSLGVSTLPRFLRLLSAVFAPQKGALCQPIIGSELGGFLASMRSHH
jgi:hypothetical protein